MTYSITEEIWLWGS